MMFDLARNSNLQGNVGIGSAIAFFSRRGFNVLLPLTDSQKYDIVVERGDMLRVQVKTVYSKPANNYKVDLRTTYRSRHEPFDHDACDMLYVLAESGECWLIPTDDFDNTTALTLTPEYDEYKLAGL